MKPGKLYNIANTIRLLNCRENLFPLHRSFGEPSKIIAMALQVLADCPVKHWDYF